MTDIELARALFRKPSDIVSEAFNGDLPLKTVAGTAMADSADGMVQVELEGTTDLADEADGYLEVPCSASIKAGESVLITLQNGVPIDATSTGWGDRIGTLADEAYQIASAIGQYAWNDSNGTHVSTEEGVAAGTRNILLNSYGILLRAAANYLAALTQSGIAFYDGQGNAASNILASFGANGAQIGADGQTHLSIDTDTVDVVDENDDTLMSMGYDATFATAMMESPMGLTLRYMVDALAKQYAFLSLANEDSAKAISAAAVDLLNGQAEIFATAAAAQSLIRLHSQHGSHDAWLEMTGGASASQINLTADTIKANTNDIGTYKQGTVTGNSYSNMGYVNLTQVGQLAIFNGSLRTTSSLPTGGPHTVGHLDIPPAASSVSAYAGNESTSKGLVQVQSDGTIRLYHATSGVGYYNFCLVYVVA